MTELRVNLPGREYPILIGKDALNEGACLFSNRFPGSKAAVVSDEIVWKLHGDKLLKVLAEQGIASHASVVRHGERSKSVDTLSRLYSEFAAGGMKRGDPVIAFGGGVVGDLAGLAAATYMRGLPFVQIPTTLLAQVDSSVGGKVAVNIPEGKNLVGGFWQPCFVIADTGLLETLPEREWRSGLAEIVKYAAIGSTSLIPMLKDRVTIKNNIERIVMFSCECKAGYVERDELDVGPRMMLNFGHTFGHAIEKHHLYIKYNHGEAVSIGMALAARAGERTGLTEPGTERDLLALMDAVGLRYGFEDRPEDIVPLMRGDKKNSGGDITLVLLKKMGLSVIHKISAENLLKVML